ncbi:hypothetical protein PHJA_001252900 [Phtheirospermum japonicum]|uniref:Uncharacterized protein n=1 Tax=Phtheirospermum japonicum TaxID=374723 RepID=A0A830BXB7_9LAMI|nr:hypothetical protein PHJA_001252900 [Phtheirospermum japonicum]
MSAKECRNREYFIKVDKYNKHRRKLGMGHDQYFDYVIFVLLNINYALKVKERAFALYVSSVDSDPDHIRVKFSGVDQADINSMKIILPIDLPETLSGVEFNKRVPELPLVIPSKGSSECSSDAAVNDYNFASVIDFPIECSGLLSVLGLLRLIYLINLHLWLISLPSHLIYLKLNESPELHIPFDDADIPTESPDLPEVKYPLIEVDLPASEVDLPDKFASVVDFPAESPDLLEVKYESPESHIHIPSSDDADIPTESPDLPEVKYPLIERDIPSDDADFPTESPDLPKVKYPLFFK